MSLHVGHTALVRQTEGLIRRKTTVLTIVKRSRVSDGSGGFKLQEVSQIPDVRAREVAQDNPSNEGTTRTTSEGIQVLPTSIYLCMPGTDVEQFDIVRSDEGDQEVVWVTTEPPHRVTVEVFSNG